MKMVNLCRRRFFSSFDTIIIIMKELSRAVKFKFTPPYLVEFWGAVTPEQRR